MRINNVFNTIGKFIFIYIYIGRLFASAKTIDNNGPDTCVFDRF